MSKPTITQRQKLSFLRSISSETRLEIICLLIKARRPMIVTDIADELGMTHSAISHQLKFLRGAQIVKGKKAGRTALYCLNDRRSAAIHGTMAALERLDAKALPVRSLEGV